MSRSSRSSDSSISVAEVLLAITRSRTVDALIDRAAGGIAAQPDVAQCRIWLARPGDVCPSCSMREQCPDRTRCLHLVANKGEVGSGDSKSAVGAFRRFPIGVGMLGRVAKSGTGDLVADVRRDPTWSRAAGWARASGIRGLVVEPMRHDAGVVGLIGAFTRVTATKDGFDWIRRIAAHTAASVDLVMSLGRIEQRLARLERENAALRARTKKARTRDPVSASASSRARDSRVLTESEMRRRERENLLEALRLTRWKIYGPDGAASLLGLRPTTLTSRIKKMNLRRDSSEKPVDLEAG